MLGSMPSWQDSRDEISRFSGLPYLRRHGRRGPIETRPHVDSIPTADREQYFSKSSKKGIWSTSTSPPAPMSSWANSPLRVWHGRTFHPDNFFLAVPPYENPERDFLPCPPTSTDIPIVCQPYAHFFLPQHLTFGGRIGRRERKTNHQVRVGNTGPSNHTYLFSSCIRRPTIFICPVKSLIDSTVSASSVSISRLRSHPLCAPFPSVFPGPKVHLQPIGRLLFPGHFRPIHLDDVLWVMTPAHHLRTRNDMPDCDC